MEVRCSRDTLSDKWDFSGKEAREFFRQFVNNEKYQKQRNICGKPEATRIYMFFYQVKNKIENTT